MRKTQPPALDMRAIFEAAWREIDTPSSPESAQLWEAIVRSAFVRDALAHEEKQKERWCWYASQLAKCPREAVLRRAELANDGTRVESRNVFAIGHLYHALAQYGMNVLHTTYDEVHTEIGGRHPDLALSARADLIYRFDGEWFIVDYKTESEFAGKHRRDEAVNGSSARWGDKLQIAATAIALEAIPMPLFGSAFGPSPVPRIERGYAVYIAKESGDVDQQPVVIDDALRAAVYARIDLLEDAWADYALSGVLPPPLPQEEKKPRGKKPFMADPGICRPRSDDDPRGLYCPARSICYQLREEHR